MQLEIRKALMNNTPIELDEITENHQGAFLALFENSGKFLAESKKTEDKLTNLTETISFLVDEMKKQDISKEQIRNGVFQLCVIRETHFLKNPLEWDIGTDGICFQWGNRYMGFFMPYEISRMGGDRVRILDRLCCYKCHVPSSLWRLPCGLVWKIVVDSYH